MSSEQRGESHESIQIRLTGELFPPFTTYVTTGFFLNPCLNGDLSQVSGDPFVACTGDELFSAKSLALRFGVDYHKLRKRLERWRRKNLDRVIVVEDSGPNSPRFLFRLRDVADILMAVSEGRNVHRESSKKNLRP